LNCIIELLPVK